MFEKLAIELLKIHFQDVYDLLDLDLGPQRILKTIGAKSRQKPPTKVLKREVFSFEILVQFGISARLRNIAYKFLLQPFTTTNRFFVELNQKLKSLDETTCKLTIKQLETGINELNALKVPAIRDLEGFANGVKRLRSTEEDQMQVSTFIYKLRLKKPEESDF